MAEYKVVREGWREVQKDGKKLNVKTGYTKSLALYLLSF